QKNLGRVRLVFKGAYNSGNAYRELDVVTDDGSSYVSLIDNNEQPLTDTAAWEVLALKGDKGDEGDKGDKGDKGDNALPLYLQADTFPDYASIVAQTLDPVNDKGKAWRVAGTQNWYFFDGTGFNSEAEPVVIGVDSEGPAGILEWDGSSTFAGLTYPTV